MKKVVFIMFMLGMVTLACQDISSVEKPENLIPEKKMEQIMYEAILLKSARGYNIGELTSAGIDPESYVLEKFHIDSTQYALNTAYYAAQLDVYTAMNMRINERVLAILVVEDSLEKIEKKISDSLRLKRNRDVEEERVARRKRDSANGTKYYEKSVTPIPMKKGFTKSNDSL